MDTCLGAGLFLLGAGAGALLTAIRYSAHIGKLRAEIESIANYRQVERERNPLNGAA